jgi:fibronectin-binding autotransporter adhesin
MWNSNGGFGMHVKNNGPLNTSWASRISTGQKKAIMSAAIAAAGLFTEPRLVHADVLLWTDGAGGGAWDNSTLNWNDTTTSTPGVAYTDGSAVQFSDSGPGGTITVANVTGAPAGVSPSSVEFTHGTGAAGNYAFTDGTGTSGITGTTSLTLDSGYAGTVTLNSANTYTGGTYINGGTLHGGTGSFSSTNTFYMGGGTYQSASGSGGTLAVGQNFSATSGTSSTIQSTSTGNNLYIQGSISGGGAGTTLNFLGGETLSTSSLSGYTGTFEFGSFGSGTVRLDFASTGAAGGSSNAIFDLGASTTTLEAYNGGGSGTGAFTNAIPLGALEGSAAGATLAGASHSSSTVYAIGALGLTTTFAGKITPGTENACALEIVGGALTLTGNSNTYNGVSGQTGTTIVGGSLFADNTSGSATGTDGVLIEGKTAQGFGTLGGNGIVTNGTTVNTTTEGVASFAQGGHLAPGPAGAGPTTGTLTLTGGLTLNDYSNLDFTLNGLSTSTGDDLISTNNGNLTLSGDSLVQANFQFNNSGPILGSPYDLINYGTGTLAYVADGSNDSLSGWTATGVPVGDKATFSFGSNQVDVSFTAVPEPATLGLLSLGAFGLLRRRRVQA